MEALKFDVSEHLNEIQVWLKDRNMSHVPECLLPKTGRIIPDVCAVFLYLTDSKVGFIENMISNPKADHSILPEALDLVVQAIEKDAKEQGVALLWSSTCIPGVVKRAERLGFSIQKRAYKLILKGI